MLPPWVMTASSVRAARSSRRARSHPHAVVWPEMLALADVPRVLDEAAMLELHALR
jgi:hypothetical protein